MDSISEQISCPVCLEIPENEIFQCRNGHNCCAQCCTSIVCCPQCRVPYGEDKVRNRTVEAIVQSLKVDCPNKAKGCSQRLLPDSLEVHKNVCEYSVNNVKLCQRMGFNCEHQVNTENVPDIIQHYQTKHGASTETVSNFSIKLDGIPRHATVRENKIWPPSVVKLADSNIILAYHLKNDMLSCLGVILEVPTHQQNQRMIEFKINDLANEAVPLVWQSPILNLLKIAKSATVSPNPVLVSMDYLRHYSMSADGSLSMNVCITQHNAVRNHLIGAAAVRRVQTKKGFTATCMYDYVGDENRTLSIKMGDMVQVIEKGTDGWCLCELHGNVGYVPVSVLDFSIHQKPSQNDVTMLEAKVQALCLYPYEAWNEEEITLKKGDIVRVISQDIYYGWWKCEFNGKTGLVPESKLTLVCNSERSISDEISANRRTNNFRWVKCKDGKHGTVQNTGITRNRFPVRAGIPGLNFKVAGCLREGKTTAVICIKNVAFRVPEYEILCIPEGYWKWSKCKNWGKCIPDGSISTGINPDGTETYFGAIIGGMGSINAKEGNFYYVPGKDDTVEKRTDYHFMLASKR